MYGFIKIFLEQKVLVKIINCVLTYYTTSVQSQTKLTPRTKVLFSYLRIHPYLSHNLRAFNVVDTIHVSHHVS